MESTRPISLTPLVDVLFDDDRVGRCLVAPDGSVLRANREWLRSTGFSLDQVIGANIVALFPDSRDLSLALHARARAGHAVHVPPHAQTIGGRETWWEGSVAPVPMDGGVGLLITAREALPPGEGHGSVERMLRRERDFTSALLDTVAALVVVLDLDGNVVRFNRACEAATGYAAGEVLGRSVFDVFIPHEELPGVRRTFERLRAGELPSRYQNRWRLKDGTRRLFAWENTDVRDANGRTELVIATGTAVEAREADSLHDPAALLRAISDTSSDVIFAKDRDGRLRFANPATLALVGKPLDEVLGKTDLEFLADQEAARRVMENDARIMASGNATELEEHVPLSDGTTRTWLSRKMPYRDASGAVVGLLGISRDITDRKRVEQALREANEKLRENDRRKDEFLGMLSHELRNPLAPIRNALYILERAEPSGAQARRAREVAMRQVAQLTRLVDDLLDVTRIARGKIQLRRVDLDLAALARRTAEDHRPVMQERGLALAVDAPARPILVNGDDTRLAQVLGNLLSNAAKFTPAGGRVTVAVAAERGRAVLAVRDTGSGVEPHMLEAIFEPFTQAEQTLARSEGGLGLGLALVKGLVHLHGGEVAAASGGTGQGTQIVVTLPLAAPPPAATSASPGAGAAGPGLRRRVLVVDDNRDAAETLAQLVELLGHDAEVAYDGPSAVAMALARPPDVVLCDLGLPGLDGYAVARELRAAGARHVRLFAVSGYAQPEDVAMAKAAGFDGHVAKPPDAKDIERILA